MEEECEKTNEYDVNAKTYMLEKFQTNAMIIFNHENFLSQSRREGTRFDEDALTNTFEQFRFNVAVHRDLDKNMLLAELQEFSKQDFGQHGCVCVAVLSHGQDHGYLRAFDASYSERELFACFDASENPSLAGKPIIFLIQACRGPSLANAVPVPGSEDRVVIQLDADVRSAAGYCLPTEADMVIFHSCFFGRASARERHSGTWFIQTVCEQINLHASADHLEKIFLRVRKSVALEKEFGQAKQMPVMTSTLLRKLYLKRPGETGLETRDFPEVHQLVKHPREHRQIDLFLRTAEQNVLSRVISSEEDLALCSQHLNQLQKMYADLLSTSTKRMSDLDSLQLLFSAAAAELVWLHEKEQAELHRDWADPHIDLATVQNYYEQLMSSLEKKELQFSNVVDRGEALIAQRHPATKTIESLLKVMQSQREWVLQLTLCLETHLQHATQYHAFFEAVKEAEQWIQEREEPLNTTFSQTEFSLDQSGSLNRGMQELKEELDAHGAVVSGLAEEAQRVRPPLQRRAPGAGALRAETVCACTHANLAIEKGSAVTVVDNIGRTDWRVRLGGAEARLPGAVLALPPPCADAQAAAARLCAAHDRVSTHNVTSGAEARLPGAVLALPPPCADAQAAAARLCAAHDRVSTHNVTSGAEARLPGAVLALPPPCADAQAAAARLCAAHDRVSTHNVTSGAEARLPGAVLALPPPCADAQAAAARLCAAHDRVSTHNVTSGAEARLPGAVLALPPPCADAQAAAARLCAAHDRIKQLWQKKQHRITQGSIIANIQMMKGWDINGINRLGVERFQEMRSAVNKDVATLLAGGDPADPLERRLRREAAELGRRCDDLERRAGEEESKNPEETNFLAQGSVLLERLDTLERQLQERAASHIPRDLNSLQQLVLQQKAWDSAAFDLRQDVAKMESTFSEMCLKTPAMYTQFDEVISKRDDLSPKSKHFVECLKHVEVVIISMEESRQTISKFQVKLMQFNLNDFPNDVKLLEAMQRELRNLQIAVSKQSKRVEWMTTDAKEYRRVVESDSLLRRKPIDLDRLDKEVALLNKHLKKICTELVANLVGCGSACQYLRVYSAGLQKESEWLADALRRLTALEPIGNAPKKQLKPARTLLMDVVERTPKIEKLNMDGGRFIMQAMMVPSRCQHYSEWLSDNEDPSLDLTQLKRQPGLEPADPLSRAGAGAGAVARELDEVNAQHQHLLDETYERLRRIATADPKNIDAWKAVRMKPKPARSFREEFNIHGGVLLI